jgi:hypothetical protein
MDEAEAMVIDRSPIIDATGMLECALSAYVVLVRIAAHRRNIEHAYALLEQLEDLGHMRKWGRMVAAAPANRVRLYITEGRITEGNACLNRLERLVGEYSAPTRCAWSDIRDYSLLARPFWGRRRIAITTQLPFCEHCARRRKQPTTITGRCAWPRNFPRLCSLRTKLPRRRSYFTRF